MMICPEAYYENHLKGKTQKEILSAIRSLKREIGHLKMVIERPGYSCAACPSEGVRLRCAREYLERAKQALAEAGGDYIPSRAELRAEEFNANIPFISKVEFCTDNAFLGTETVTYTLYENNIGRDVEHSLMLKPSNLEDAEDENLSKESFLEGLAELCIGEWLRLYDSRRWGICVLDGVRWHLYVYYSNGRRPVKIEGNNDYPYNFDEMQELFGLDCRDS